MNADLSSKPLLARPTFVRYGVLAFACSLSMVTYLDRASIGMAAKPICDALGFTDVGDLAWAMTSFSLAYARL